MINNDDFHYYKMRNLCKILGVLLLIVMLTGCSSIVDAQIESRTGGIANSKITLLENEAYLSEFPEVDIGTIASSGKKSLFRIGDTAEVQIYNVDSLSNSYVVDESGNISFPLIGEISVAGKSTTELRNVLSEMYGNNYLQSPGINVKRETTTLGRIVVDGAVNKPGVFEVDDIIRLSEAIALAEGIDSVDTNGSSVYIVRTINNERKISTVDLRSIRKFGASDPQIIPNDVIFIEDTPSRIIFREFLRTVPLLNTAVILATR